MIAGAHGHIDAGDNVVHWFVRLCGWCLTPLDPTSRDVLALDLKPRRETHGICPRCSAQHFPEAEA